MNKIVFIFLFFCMNATAQLLPTIEQYEDLFLKEITIEDIDPYLIEIKYKRSDNTYMNHCYAMEFLEPIFYYSLNDGSKLLFLILSENHEEALSLFEYYAVKMFEYFDKDIYYHKFKKHKNRELYLAYNNEKNLMVIIDVEENALLIEVSYKPEDE